MSMNNTKLYGILIAVVLISGGVLAALVLFQPQPVETDVPFVVVVGGTGNAINVTLTEMLEMTSITKNGSYQNSYGNIRGYGLYTGINVSDLVDLVGGMSENDTLKITASDEYSMIFEYGKVYPNASILALQGDMVLAYEYNETRVPDYEVGFRIAFLPDDGYYSNADANATTDPNPSAAGPQWVSNVAKIEVITPVPPEPVALVVNYGETTLSFTLNELKALANISGQGGYRKSTGTINGPYNVTGVAFSTLLSLLPALPANYTLTAIAGDDWISVYTKKMVEGNLSGYNSTGYPVESIQSTMVLAYEMDGNPIPAGDGPLRIAFLNVDGNLTDGSLWAKYIVNITIVEVPVTVPLMDNLAKLMSFKTGLDFFLAEVKSL